MNTPQQKLRHIVAHAMPLAERLSGELSTDVASPNDRSAQNRLERWCQVAAEGDRERFGRRLAWDGLDEHTALGLLGAVQLHNDRPLPAWAATFVNVLDAGASMPCDEHTYRFLKPEMPLPFEELFVPFIEVATRNVLARTTASYALLTDTAHAALERGLLLRLMALCAPSLELEFSLFRASRQSLNRLFGLSSDGPSHEQYLAFIAHLLENQLWSFFEEYTVLARLTATATDLWVDATVELLERLDADWPAIQQTFGGESEIGQVIAVSASLSDPHNQGRTVVGITFASGLKLMYKPKDLGLEVAYRDLLGWCNAQGAPLPFNLLRMLVGRGYGWVEYVTHAPCHTPEEVQRFYQRAGMLLCLVHTLCGTDFHHENIIACGEHPVLVDLEMLLQAGVQDDHAPTGDTTARSLAHQQLWNSVLCTGFLPRWEFGPDGRGAYDISGLGGIHDQELSIRMPRWKHINTDHMALTYEPGNMSAKQNAPALDGVRVTPNAYLEAIVDGFRQMYSFLSQRRAALREEAGPLAALACQQVRFVFRPTKVYGLLLQKTLVPSLLRNGADHSIEFDRLSRGLLPPAGAANTASAASPRFWPMLRVEQAALEQRDIPFFAAPAASLALPIGPQLSIEHCFAETGPDRVLARINQFGPDDLEQQIGVIRSAFYARGVDMPHDAPGAMQPACNLTERMPLPQHELVQRALAIGHDLGRRAIQATDGSSTWIGMEYMISADRFQLQPLGHDLYNGCAGVALFLAALEHVTHGAGLRDLALAAVQPFRKLVSESDPVAQRKLARQVGIGGAVGLGSIIYALVQIQRFLNAPALLEDANRAARLIESDQIAGDEQLDVIAGSAGAMLGLLALYTHAPQPGVLERAVQCGQHLLDSRVVSPAGYRTWATKDGELLTGFSHGASGIAYALLRLYHVTGDRNLLAAAQEAIAYEQSVFSPAAGNWPDYRGPARSDGKLPFMNQWCHGAPGIGLARLGGLPMLDTDAIRAEIAVAVQTTQRASLTGADHLCCGNFGRIETLLVAAARLGRPELYSSAQQWATYLIDQADPTATFNLFPGLPRSVYNPGFFRGAAGIGYELLRLAHPDTLPSVLLWE